MEQESFYLTLPSNVQSSPTNSLSNYYTILPHRITLNGEWKVGLAEISYTKSWYNIPEDQDLHIYDKLYSQLRLKNYEKAVLKKGFYENEQILISELNKIGELYDIKERPKLVLDEITKKVTKYSGLDKDNDAVFLFLNSNLRDMLGFPKKRDVPYKYHIENSEIISFEIYEPERMEVAERPIDMKRGIRSLFVYSDIVHPVRVGDSQVQLLRNVEVPENSKFGGQCVLKYEQPYYHPLITDDFNSIRIYIKDDSGFDIPFEFGRVTITLHLKKWSNTI